MAITSMIKQLSQQKLFSYVFLLLCVLNIPTPVSGIDLLHGEKVPVYTLYL